MSTHSFGRNVPAELIRKLVALGADDRDKLHAALRAHFSGTSNPWNKGRLATIDAWAKLSQAAGVIDLIRVGERAHCKAPADKSAPPLIVYRYVAKPVEDLPQKPKPIRLRRASWGHDATPATIWQAVSDGAINRFELADWINELLHGVCHPISPIKAETWAMYGSRSGAILRFPQRAGEEPYIHRPGEYRARFYRYAPGIMPEAKPVVPQGVDACADILDFFKLLPTAVPPVGVGRVHLWDTDTEQAAPLDASDFFKKGDPAATQRDDGRGCKASAKAVQNACTNADVDRRIAVGVTG